MVDLTATITFQFSLGRSVLSKLGLFFLNILLKRRAGHSRGVQGSVVKFDVRVNLMPV